MTTQTPTPPPTDNERLSRLEDIAGQQNDRLGRLEDIAGQQNGRLARLEGIVSQMSERLNGIERRLDAVESRLESLRNMMFIGFGLMWATMVAGFIAVLTFSP